jgi:hypothetical protein
MLKPFICQSKFSLSNGVVYFYILVIQSVFKTYTFSIVYSSRLNFLFLLIKHK